MKEIRIIDDAAFTFIDHYKGKNRLNIKVHGEPGAPGETSKVVFSDRKLTPEDLHHEILKRNYDLLNSTHKCNAHPCMHFVRRLPAQALARA